MISEELGVCQALLWSARCQCFRGQQLRQTRLAPPLAKMCFPDSRSCAQMRRAGGSSSSAGNTASNPSMMGMNPMMMGMMGQARFKLHALCLLYAELKPSAPL